MKMVSESLKFEEIVLSNEEHKLLRQIARHFLADCRDNPCAEALSDLGLAKKTMVAVPGHSYLYALVITRVGRQYLAYVRKLNRRDRIEATRFAWSTTIAILALFIAIAALLIDLWQLGLLRWLQG